MRSWRMLLLPLTVITLVAGLSLVAQGRAEEPELTASQQEASSTEGDTKRSDAIPEFGLFLPEAKPASECESPSPMSLLLPEAKPASCSVECQFANREECLVQCDCDPILCHKICTLDGCCNCICP
jgi:hypothetical protein